jgi:F0F1-type ATP synthase assembly protein I
MIWFIIKVLVSALVVAIVTGISRHYPGIGGWIAALPIISLLSAVWLVAGHQSNTEVAKFLMGVLKGLFPTAILLLVMVSCLRRSWPFVPSLGAAIVVWGGLSFVLQRVGW